MFQQRQRNVLPFFFCFLPLLVSLLSLHPSPTRAFQAVVVSPRRLSPWTTNSNLRTTRSFFFLKATSSSTRSHQDKTYTIQILMSDTGGGHRASANALRDAFHTLYSPQTIECDIVDLYTEYGPVWPYNDYPRMYKLLAHHSWAWDWFFQFGCTPTGLWLNSVMLELVCFDAFVQCLNRTTTTSSTSSTLKRRADMVVSVHPLCQDIALKCLAYLDSDGTTRDVSARTTPFCTVVTDLASAHPTWFHTAVDTCFVPSDALYQMALQQCNLQPLQIVQHGLPIRRGFWSENSSSSTTSTTSSSTTSSTTSSRTKQQWRQQLGLNTDMPTVLLMGGGDGMGGLVEMALALQHELQKNTAQLVVICGNNQNALTALLLQSQSQPNKNMSIQGFVTNIDEYMRAADVLVTKAGPGTIAEACICGLPCLLFAYLPGQEEGNLAFVEQGGFGRYCTEPEVIATTVQSWISDPVLLQEMQQKALAAARPQATLDIARDLAQILFQTRDLNSNEESVVASTRSYQQN